MTQSTEARNKAIVLEAFDTQAKNWVVADFVRVVDGILVEHWDVVEDEASQAESKSGRPMFGDHFPV
jgi:predicted SnoaL-like aldol condensation-catalyzing enzyme